MYASPPLAASFVYSQSPVGSLHPMSLSLSVDLLSISPGTAFFKSICQAPRAGPMTDTSHPTPRTGFLESYHTRALFEQLHRGQPSWLKTPKATSTQQSGRYFIGNTPYVNHPRKKHHSCAVTSPVARQSLLAKNKCSATASGTNIRCTTPRG
ncbi:hypothetical protein P168DRAFT_302012 [Aspergillus campestris IBT 28561]|uniref:Uncharacterized protein n=1 Tax=Aspergillus campestris (strain IBT 28561) TaxID=1392248 RepID=A0A2I1DAV5_ASPC2|nr:uncharacterized protein P168DRAFT_302012 [Aspergillus campestris IBT 28561]PKY06998.1 hypothetical protein P168DRAFT_302012 [Aspergillus campestris IBT 28561]